MSGNSHVSLRWPAAALAMLALLTLGAGGMYFWLHRSATDDRAIRPQSASEPAPSTGAAQSNATDVVVTLPEEAIKRAGVELASARQGAAESVVRIPGTVEPNAYKQVVVTPLVAGRVTRVLVELGDQVRRGQTLTEIYSPELAEAQTKYLSAKAELDAHEHELDRTQKLAAIGAASQQELERLHAEHAAKVADAQSLRSRLVLLGISASAIDALTPGKTIDASTSVPAPIAGAITERAVNTGVNVDTSTKLFTVVDLSSVWVVGALYERDFSRVRVGNAAKVTTTAYPGLALQGRVSYIDPQVSADTRTARVRVEVLNARQELRLGMYADLEIAAGASKRTVLIPRSGVQNVGDRQVVYVADSVTPGTFRERQVHLGPVSGDLIEVESGVVAGERIVSKGSFFVRAEHERMGVSAPTMSATVGGRGPSKEATRIVVGEQGYQPSQVTARAGVPVRLTFVRTTDKTCGTAVTIPSLNIRRELPLNQSVTIEFTPAKTGSVEFVCGMNMLRGTIVVQ